MKDNLFTLLRATLFFLFIAACLTKTQPARSIESGYTKDPSITEAWISKAEKGVTKTLGGRFLLDRFKDRIYFLLSEIGWRPNTKDIVLPTVVVPKGFVTDFASIPPIFYSLLLPDGEYAYAAVIHDYLYWHQNISRDRADLIFWHAMRDLDINIVKATLIYGAVRAGGWFAWESNHKAKAAGEKRILKRFPQDPTTTWSEWKSKDGVF